MTFNLRPWVRVPPGSPLVLREPLMSGLNNVVEQDHRAIKRQVRPMLGFKSFWSAAVTFAGIELMHMIRKGQLKAAGHLCPAQQFYSLAS
jgi:putative transposase